MGCGLADFSKNLGFCLACAHAVSLNGGCCFRKLFLIRRYSATTVLEGGLERLFVLGRNRAVQQGTDRFRPLGTSAAGTWLRQDGTGPVGDGAP